MGVLRYVAAPRSVVTAAVGDMAGWRELGQRMLDRARELCPVSEDDPEVPRTDNRPHLKETLEVKYITGTDPRILIGSHVKGDVLAYVVEGTPGHPIDPVNATVLRFRSGGEVVFARHVDHPGTAANNFVLEAVRQAAGAV